MSRTVETSAHSLTEIADDLIRTDPELALPLYRTAAQLVPNDLTVCRRVAIAAADADRTADALALFDRAFALDPVDRDTVLAFGNAFAGRARLAPRVLEACERYLVAHPTDPDVLAIVDRARTRRERLEQRLAAWFASVPKHLVEKVNGSPDLEVFRRIGCAVAGTIAEHVDNLSEARSVLDFGCGLGRVLWPMMQRCPGARFTGFDVDPMMLEHARRAAPLSSCRFVHTTRDLPSGSVDAVYVISVFTHLTDTTDYWLSELHRLLSERGRAFITYHDETLWSEFRAKGVVPPTPGEGEGSWCVGAGAEGSTKQGVFYTTEHWEHRLDPWFTIERTEPRGLSGHQSFSVVGPKPSAADRGAVFQTYAASLEDELFQLRKSTKLLF